MTISLALNDSKKKTRLKFSMQVICFFFLLKLVKTFLNGCRMVEDRSDFMVIQCATPPTSNKQQPTSNNKQHRTTNNISFSLRLFLDGDCRVEPTHLKDMFDYLITENLAACGCFLLTEKVALKLKTTGARFGGETMPRCRPGTF